MFRAKCLVRWRSHVELIGKNKNVYKVLAEKSESKGYLVKPKYRYKGNIKVVHKLHFPGLSEDPVTGSAEHDNELAVFVKG